MERMRCSAVRSGEKPAIPWNVVIDDDLPGVRDPQHPTRFFVPEGYSGYCEFHVCMVFQANDNGFRNVYSQCNGLTTEKGYPFGYLTGVLTPGFLNKKHGDNSTSGDIRSPIFRPTPGDFWEIIVSQKSGETLDIDGRARNSIWCQIEWWPD